MPRLSIDVFFFAATRGAESFLSFSPSSSLSCPVSLTCGPGSGSSGPAGQRSRGRHLDKRKDRKERNDHAEEKTMGEKVKARHCSVFFDLFFLFFLFVLEETSFLLHSVLEKGRRTNKKTNETRNCRTKKKKTPSRAGKW